MRVSKASNVIVVFVGNIVLVEREISQCDYRFVVQRENDSSFAATFQILEDCITKGKSKLIDRRGHCYNVKRRRGNATDWQCTVRPKVTFVKLSYAVFSRERLS